MTTMIRRFATVSLLWTCSTCYLNSVIAFTSTTSLQQQSSIRTTIRNTAHVLHSSAVSTELPPSPTTIWGSKIGNIVEAQANLRAQHKNMEFAPTISAKDLGIQGNTEAQLQYFKDNALQIKSKMVENAAVIFRDFDLMKSQDGFVQFYNAVGMKTCLDPLHSVSARPTVDGKKGSPVYEAVNKESRKNFFIGMYVLHS